MKYAILYDGTFNNKKEEVLINSKCGLSLKIMLHEKSQLQRVHAEWFHLCEMSGIGKSIDSRLMIAGTG